MNGAHDMGGRQGYGPVHPESDEPVFHAKWEARVFGMANGLGSHCTWTLDEDRHTCENRPPAELVASNYYATWMNAVGTLLVATGKLSDAELTSGQASGKYASPSLLKANVRDAVMAPASYHRETQSKPQFAVGQHIRTRNLHVSGHTRLPGYLKSHRGKIVALHGHHVWPDSNAHGKGEDPRWLYSVQFTAQELWGRASPDLIHADLWEPYLESV